MQPNEEEMSRNNSFLAQNFDFNEWKELHKNKPLVFEEKRKNLIDNFIMSAPEKYRHRLRGIMFQVDAIRMRSKNPIQACVEISAMMQKSLSDLSYFLNDLNYTLNGVVDKDSTKKISAKILKFDR